MVCLDDNDLAALISGRLAPERVREVELHLDSCADCRQLAAAGAKSRPAPTPGPGAEEPASAGDPASAHRRKDAAPGEGVSASGEAAPPGAQQLGRYSVLQPIGAGAMGVVYAAYDPVLDRRVALKLLHSGGGDVEKLRARLVREAQAMARLSHPNVIAVHDVGRVHDQVFVAMEFVAGQTLRQWAAQKQPWREVLRVFVLAGRGLAAAHAAGLVHRDFKPDNVLIGDDGRVRVTDFGLALKDEQAPPLERASLEVPVAQGSLSVQGALVGSPAYMAPEQLRGEAVDARADQFSFAVSLCEALYGERPFGGATLSLQLAEIESGRVRPEPPGARVPLWVRRVLLRALAARPGDRFPTLAALLDALEADPAVSRRRWLLGGSALALVAALALLLRWQGARQDQQCLGAEEKTQRAFSPALREKARQAFAASKLAYASEGWTQAEKVLDGYAAAWARQRTDACEATALRHEQSPELLDLRMACLDDRLRGLAATAQLFAEADTAVVAHAASVAGTLPSLDSCNDAQALRALPAPAPAQLAPSNAVRDGLAQLRVQVAAGRRSELFPRAQALADQAQAIGYGPLVAETLLELGIARLQDDQVKEARETLLHAVAAGVRWRVDRIVAAAWTRLIGVCIQLSRREEAGLAAQFAQAAVARLGNDPVAGSTLEITLGMLAELDTDLDAQLQHVQRAVALLEPLPPGVNLIEALDQLAFALTQKANLPAALATAKRVLALAISLQGKDHISVGEKEGLVGDVLSRSGQHAAAAEHFDRAVSIIEAADGKDSMLLVDVLRERSGNASSLRQLDRALADAQRALQISLLRLGPDKFDAAFSRGYLADVLQARGDLAEATAQYRQALEVFDRIGEAMGGADLRASLAQIALRQGRTAEARQLAERALRAVREKLPPGHPIIAVDLVVLGRVALRERRFAEAHRLFSESLEIMRAAVGEGSDVWRSEQWLAAAELESGDAASALARLERIEYAAQAAPDQQFDDAYARLLLARSLWATGSDRPRARKLAAAAREEFASRGRGSREELAEASRFLGQLGER